MLGVKKLPKRTPNMKDFKYFDKKNIFSLFIITLIFFLDRISKIKIINQVSDNNIYINDFINLNLVWNTGIGFGLLSSNSSLIYNSVSVVIFL